jgi:hypothetical protein
MMLGQERVEQACAESSGFQHAIRYAIGELHKEVTKATERGVGDEVYSSLDDQYLKLEETWWSMKLATHLLIRGEKDGR